LYKGGIQNTGAVKSGERRGNIINQTQHFNNNNTVICFSVLHQQPRWPTTNAAHIEYTNDDDDNNNNNHNNNGW
jgi:hypothetical protein